MSWKNFVPLVEKEAILKEREKNLIFVANCARGFYGENFKKLGDTVTVRVKGKIDVFSLTMDKSYAAGATDDNGHAQTTTLARTGKDIVQFEPSISPDVPYTDISMKVDKIAYWNNLWGDIDQSLSEIKTVKPEWRESIGSSLSDEQEKYVASKILDNAKLRLATSLYDSSAVKVVATDTTSSTEIYVLDLLDNIRYALSKRHIGAKVPLACECDTKFYNMVRKALNKAFTTNNGGIEGGAEVLKYYNFTIHESPDAVNSAGAPMFDVRTLDAVNFVDPLLINEPYRASDGKHADGLSGYQVYDAMVTKPMEVITVQPRF